MQENTPHDPKDHRSDPRNDIESTIPIPPNSQLPTYIGPFRILELLGKGGMGEVYLAEQKSPIKRRVALKLIKVGMDTREVIARFEAERQALAMMNHPYIARIFDAGSSDHGRPYFIMEHVSGDPITDYCDRHCLNNKERLELFSKVCEAVHHAHQKGIIHRDLKPSNVLVSIQGGKPVPKIIDFGVAKAIEQRLAEMTVYTEQGRLIGTPEYMSPEQAEMTGMNVDTTTDTYSLGVMLYELLTGKLPFERNELLKAGLASIQLVIRTVDPPKPSARISHISDEQSSLAAKRRRTLPPTWLKQVKGELDWITMKSMEKDRTRRYSSPLELSADIQSYLRSEPVLAGPPGSTYQIKKFVQRNRLGVVASGFVLLALFLGLLGTGYGLVRANRANRVALEAEKLANQAAEQSKLEAESSRRMSELMAKLIAFSDPEQGKTDHETARKMLDFNLQQIEDNLADYPVPRARLMVTIGKIYSSMGMYDRAERIISSALDLQERHLPEDDLEMAGTMVLLSNLLLNEYGKIKKEQAGEYIDRAFSIQEKVLDPGHPDLALTWLAFASYRILEDDSKGAREYYDRALAIAEEYPHLVDPQLSSIADLFSLIALAEDDSSQAGNLEELAKEVRQNSDTSSVLAEANIAWIRARQVVMQSEDWGQAQQILEEALAVQREAHGGDHPEQYYNLLNYGVVLEQLGDFSGSAGIFSGILEFIETNPDAVSGRMKIEAEYQCLVSLARVQFLQGKREEAESTIDQAATKLDVLLEFGMPNDEIRKADFSSCQGAIKNDREKVVDGLRRMLELGFPMEGLKNNSFFLQYFGESEFKVLINDLEAADKKNGE